MFDPDQGEPVAPPSLINSFDPPEPLTTAPQEGLTAPPVDITTGFNPDQAEPVHDLMAQDARSSLHRYTNGEIDLDHDQLVELHRLAANGTGPWGRLENAVAGLFSKKTGTAIKDAVVSGVKGAGEFIKEETGIGEDPLSHDYSRDIAQDDKNLVGGIIGGGSKLIPFGYDLATGLTNLAIPSAASQTNATADQLTRFTNDAVKASDAIVGADAESASYHAGELIPQAFLPIGVEAKAAKTTAKIADAVVEGAPKVAGAVISGGAKTAKTVGPAIGAGAELAAGHPYAAIATLIAGYGGPDIPILGRLRHAIIDRGFDRIDDLGKALAKTRDGETIIGGLQSDALGKVTKINEQIDDIVANNTGKVEDAFKKAKDGTPLYDTEELSGAAKKVRELQDQSSNYQQRASRMEKYKDLNRVLSDSAKFAGRTTLNLGVGGATGAALIGPTGEEGEEQDTTRAGFGIGAAFSALGAYDAARRGKLGANRDALIAKGKKIVDPSQLSGLSPEAQDYVHAHAGLVSGLGGKVELLSPEEILAKSSAMPPTEGATAPNGYFDPPTNTLFINREALNSGVMGHEFVHLAQQQVAKSFEGLNHEILGRINSPDVQKNSAYKQFAESYTERMRKSVPNFEGLSPEQVNSEVQAEIGRQIFHNLPPEAFYGGKGGGRIVSDWLSKTFSKEGTTKFSTVPGFDAPYSKNDLKNLQDIFFKVGELAKTGEKPSPSLPQAPPEPVSPDPAVSTPAGEPNTSKEAPVHPFRQDTVDALVALGAKRGDAETKTDAAIQELSQKGEFTQEDLLKNAVKRGQPLSEKLPKVSDKNLSKIGDLKVPPAGTPPEVKAEMLHHEEVMTNEERAALHKAIESGAIKNEDDFNKWINDRIVSRAHVLKSIKTLQDSGDPFKVTFLKSDGSLREMNAQFGLPEGVKAPRGGRKTTTGNPNLYTVWDHDTQGWRTFPADSVQKIEGKNVDYQKPQFMPGGDKVPLDKYTSEDKAIEVAKSHGLSYNGEGDGTYHFTSPEGKEVVAVRGENIDDFEARIKNPAHQFMPAPDPGIEGVIRDYADRAGIDYVPHHSYHPINEDYSKRMSDQYEQQTHDPGNPEVQKAYDAFRDGVMGQYQTLLDHGYKIEPWTKDGGQPYANSGEMLKDLRDNKHLYYFRTEIGYGNKGGSTAIQHPMTRGSGVFFDGKEAMINDIFRGVHDALGHGHMGFQFGPRGEYNAFLAHKSTLPVESHKALATETLGQNSFTNFGPHMRNEAGDIIKPGEPGHLPITERPYTEQRANLLNFMPSPIEPHEVAGTNSRSVSKEEFDRISARGKEILGTLKKGSAPTTGLTENWNSVLDKSWAEAQKSWGGLAIDAHTGETKTGPIGQGGEIGKGPYSVTAKEDGQQTIEIPETASREEFNAAMARAREAFPQLQNKDYHLSVFHDDGKKTIDIDPTVIVRNSRDAEALGAHTRNVGGVYDFDSGNGLYPPHVAPERLKVQKDGTAKAWIDPGGKIHPLQGEHYGWFQRNPEEAKRFGITNPSKINDTGVSKGEAVKKGFTRVNLERNGTMRVEVAKDQWGKSKDSIRQLVDQELGNVIRVDISLLDKNNKVVGGEEANVYRNPQLVDNMGIWSKYAADPTGGSKAMFSRRQLDGLPMFGEGPVTSMHLSREGQYMPAALGPGEGRELTPKEQELLDKVHSDGHEVTGIDKSPSRFRVKFNYSYGGSGSRSLVYDLGQEFRNTLHDIKDGHEALRRMKSSDKLGGDLGPNADSEPWVHRYFELDKKQDAGTITAQEEKEWSDLFQKAEKEYGSFDNFYKAHGGKQYNAKNLFQFMPSPHPDAIIGAAVKDKDGGIHTGITHTDAIEAASDAGYGDEDLINDSGGFVDRKGKYYDRVEAANHAVSIKQLDRKFANHELDAGGFNQVRHFMPSSHPDAIDEPALRMADGKVFKASDIPGGRFHEDAETAAKKAGYDWELRKMGVDGWTTKTGRFLNREDAATHAKAIKQMTEEDYDRTSDDHGVEPEDLESHAFEDARAFMPAEAEPVQTKDGEVATQPSLVFMPAHHGTPHEVDRFSTDKIGSGEGTQAFGWGLYFAEHPKVAESYLPHSDPAPLTVNGGNKYNAEDPTHIAARFLNQNQGNREAAILDAQKDAATLAGVPSLDSMAKSTLEAVNVLQENGEAKVDPSPKEGNLYTVDLDVEPHELLHWDKTLDQQDPGVLEKLRAIDHPELRSILSDPSHETGASLYRMLDKNPEKASKLLDSSGIKGIRFLDNFSRRKGDGTHNYVMFDPERIKITHANGERQFMAATPEDVNAKIAKMTAASRKKNPEAAPLLFQKDKEGNYKLDKKGNPKPQIIPYDLYNSPVGRVAARGAKTPEERQEKVAKALGDKMVEHFKSIEHRPEVMAGKGWYQVARTKLNDLFKGNMDDVVLFSRFLAATSARTGVLDNFKQAVDAFNQLKSGAFGEAGKRYIELRDQLRAGELKDDKGNVIKPGGFKAYLDKNGILPHKSNGYKYNANSEHVLKVLADVWHKEAAQKTVNFAGNLTGETLRATIDVWASRLVHRLSGAKRVLPKQEGGIAPADFQLSQRAFDLAAEQLQMNPDDLQAIMWFAEKSHWDARGWTGAEGKKLSDFRPLIDFTNNEGDGLKMQDLPDAYISKKELKERAKRAKLGDL